MPPFDSHDDSYDWFTILKDIKVETRDIEWVRQLLEHPPEIAEPVRGSPVADYLTARLREAGQAVRELEHELYVRERLHEQSAQQLDYQIGRAALALERFKGWGVGYNRGVDEMRIELERTLRDLRKEKRAWRVRTWDDVVRLRRELRVTRQAYDAMRRRSHIG